MQIIQQSYSKLINLSAFMSTTAINITYHPTSPCFRLALHAIIRAGNNSDSSEIVDLNRVIQILLKLEPSLSLSDCPIDSCRTSGLHSRWYNILWHSKRIHSTPVKRKSFKNANTLIKKRTLQLPKRLRR